MKLSDVHILLAQIRKTRDKTQRDIADTLNMEQATVSLYESGKRGIPLPLLDDWLELLEIEVQITPREIMPVKPEEETQSDLDAFEQLKNRRNYLIAELRAMMAEKIAQEEGIGDRLNEETDELKFWPYSFCGDPAVGLVETRYDHPQQKYLAVEYTKNEVNVYRFLDIKETYNEHSDPKWLNADRVYFSEDDFLTIGDIWETEHMEARKVTILRRNESAPDGVEIINPEGFGIRSLLEMQENLMRLIAVIRETERMENYRRMEDELDAIMDKLGNISLNNRLRNGSTNPAFEYWTEKDRDAIDVPLYKKERDWVWIEEGVQWYEEDQEEYVEIRLTDSTIPHEHLHVLCDEDGNRVIGLIGQEQSPAFFKTSASKPDAIYRVKTDIDELNEKEKSDYGALLEATNDLKELRDVITDEQIDPEDSDEAVVPS